MATQVGKRYICKRCGAEFIVTRGGKESSDAAEKSRR